jgi:predicted ATPase
LAERAGLSVRGLRYLERGLRHPYRSTVLRLSEALDLDASATTALRELWVRDAADVPPRSIPAPHSPRASGPLIGREAELHLALRLLGEDHVRLLTVTGQGGVGKTRFAVEAATRIAQAGGTVVVWVPLAAVTGAASVPGAVARAVGVTAGSTGMIDELADALQEQILLLDNAEHVAACGSFLADLALRCPSLTVIVTSRVPLGIHLEQRFPLQPLPIPDPSRTPDLHALAVNAAVDLFLRRLQAVNPQYALTAANAPAVMTVVTRLDGLPLALELAAARSATLPPEVMATRLDHGLDVLRSDARDLPDRQRTMRATIAWSHDLLPSHSQVLFRRLAVFEDGAALESIDALPTAARLRRSPHDPTPSTASTPVETAAQPDSSPPLDALVSSSLLSLDPSRPEAPRYRMHELVRAYGHEQLTLTGEDTWVKSWHAEHFLGLAEEAQQHFFASDATAWLDRLEAEHANLRTALGWFHAHDSGEKGLRLAGALSWFWYVRGHAVEGRAHLDTLLATDPAPTAPGPTTAVRVAALQGAGHLAQTQGDYRSARTYLDQAIALTRATHDQPGLAAALLAGGFVARVDEDYPTALRMLHEAAALATATGSDFLLAATHHHLGMIAADACRDPTTARRHLHHSLSIYRRLHLARFEALVLLSLADSAHLERDLPSAARLASRSLQLMQTTGEQLALHGALDTLAGIALSQHDPARGVPLAGAAARLRQLHNVQSWPVVQRRLQEQLTAAQSKLTPAEYQDLWDDGYTLTPPQALDLALKAGATP